MPTPYVTKADLLQKEQSIMHEIDEKIGNIQKNVNDKVSLKLFLWILSGLIGGLMTLVLVSIPFAWGMSDDLTIIKTTLKISNITTK